MRCSGSLVLSSDVLRNSLHIGEPNLVRHPFTVDAGLATTVIDVTKYFDSALYASPPRSFPEHILQDHDQLFVLRGIDLDDFP